MYLLFFKAIVYSLEKNALGYRIYVSSRLVGINTLLGTWQCHTPVKWGNEGAVIQRERTLLNFSHSVHYLATDVPFTQLTSCRMHIRHTVPPTPEYGNHGCWFQMSCCEYFRDIFLCRKQSEFNTEWIETKNLQWASVLWAGMPLIKGQWRRMTATETQINTFSNQSEHQKMNIDLRIWCEQQDLTCLQG